MNKKRISNFLVGLLSLLFSLQVSAQDTVNIMYYNLLNYPGNTPWRCDTLRKIVQHYKPDLFVVNELESLYGANLILNKALNTFGISHYQSATFVNGPDTDNLLYYNSQKFGLKSQQQIATTLRDISEYVLYYKPSAPSGDTIFLHVYSLHLKAGWGSVNEQQRQQEAITLKNHIFQSGYSQNIMVGGDLNLYAASEPAYGTLLNSGMPLYDPVNKPGNWSDNLLFAAYHTQSVRTESYLGGGGGGMDDRFDHILLTGDIMGGLNKIKYIPNSYWAYGQDGIRFDSSLISPPNVSLPDSVLKAMYNMSDHLPVVLKLFIDPNLNTIENAHEKNNNWQLSPNPSNGLVYLSVQQKDAHTHVRCYNNLGQEVSIPTRFQGTGLCLDFTEQANGIYFIQLPGKTEKIIIHRN